MESICRILRIAIIQSSANHLNNRQPPQHMPSEPGTKSEDLAQPAGTSAPVTFKSGHPKWLKAEHSIQNNDDYRRENTHWDGLFGRRNADGSGLVWWPEIRTCRQILRHEELLVIGN
jgi:hypothetical protein